MTGRRVWTGLDREAEAGFPQLRGRRVGAICNPTSVDWRMEHLADLLHGSDGVELVALFGPEHGIRGDAQDMEGVGSEVDPATGIPVYSLYGGDVGSLRPRAEWLDGLDALVFDVQDVGSRHYTFAATMLYAMEACSGRGIRFVVYDRPNPIGGVRVEGPSVDPGYESFVGVHPVPIRHGMTVGELARLFAAELSLDLELRVVACRGWERAMHWPETGIPWIAPSPNMPSYETALVYPGGCLIEGTNLSEGRGTTRPFEQWGAPWLEPRGFPRAAVAAEVLVRGCAFRPMFHKFAGQVCQGLYPHVLDRERFEPVRLYGRFLEWAWQSAPGEFRWRTEAYEFVTEPIAIDLLFGSSRPRMAIEAGRLGELDGEWRAAEEEFLRRRRPFLIYDEPTALRGTGRIEDVVI
ncbi:MAG: hypothetical protein KatS3mg108_1436 [Isosphaeraceae bacterium]|jgi:uncharacterized protein YbbC (DUF1343 family)|nr:MAG: hypothetical protein KatS3mg108_1436 [Isosphaeraceae bacterium]